MTALPQWVQPQLAQLVDATPEGDQWLHEIKYDGYRMHENMTGSCWREAHSAIHRGSYNGVLWLHLRLVVIRTANSSPNLTR